MLTALVLTAVLLTALLLTAVLLTAVLLTALSLTALLHPRVYDLETKLAVETTFRYPSFRYLHWHLGSYLAELSAEKVHALTTTSNLQALVAALNAWKV